MVRSAKNGRKSTVKTAKKLNSSVPAEKSNRQSYMSKFLWLAVFLDTIVMMAPTPSLTLHSVAAPSTLEGIVLFQLLFFLPQLGTTLLAERMGKRIRGMRAYAATLFATSICTFITAKALRDHSMLLYFAARFLTGALRHAVTLGAMAWNELPDNASKEHMVTAKLFGHPFAMLIGGVLADSTPNISVAMDIMGFVELGISVLVGFLSLSRVQKPKTLPLVQSAAAYRDWLWRQPYRRFYLFLPMALLVLSASFVQCMYPYNDFIVFHLSFTAIGFHMAAVVGLQLLSPRLVKWYGSAGQQRLIHTCVVPFVVGACISGWAERQGDVRIYIFVTFFLTDLPHSVLCAVFGSIISEGFLNDEKPFALKALFHLQMVIKLWLTVFMNLTIMFFQRYGRVDGQQVIAVSAALGVVSFVKYRSVSVTLAAFVGAISVLTHIPPLDDEDIWNLAMEQFISYIDVINGDYNT